MRSQWRTGLSAVLCATFISTLAPTPSRAGVMTVPDKTIVAPASGIETIRYRHRPAWRYVRVYRYARVYRHRRRHRYVYNPGAAIFSGLALGLLSGAYDSGPDYGYYPAYGWGGGGWGGGGGRSFGGRGFGGHGFGGHGSGGHGMGGHRH